MQKTWEKQETIQVLPLAPSYERTLVRRDFDHTLLSPKELRVLYFYPILVKRSVNCRNFVVLLYACCVNKRTL